MIVLRREATSAIAETKQNYREGVAGLDMGCRPAGEDPVGLQSPEGEMAQARSEARGIVDARRRESDVVGARTTTKIA